MIRHLLVPTALLLLAACGQQAAEPAAPEPAAPAEPTLATAERSVAYVCERDLPITAIYGTDLEGERDVALVIQGRDYRLRQTVAASGARYVTEFGLEPGMGLVWWERGDEAMLQQVPVEMIDNMDAPQTIRTCRVKAD